MGLHVSLFKEVASVTVPSPIVGVLSDELNGRYAEYCTHIMQKAHDLVTAMYSLDNSYAKSVVMLGMACRDNPKARIFVRHGCRVCFTKEDYADTIPHTFGPLAIALGVYDELWGIAHEDWQEWMPAESMIKKVDDAVNKLTSAKDAFSKYGADPDVFEGFLRKLSHACKTDPRLMFMGKIV